MSRLESRRRQRRDEISDSSEDDASLGSASEDSGDEVEETSESELESVAVVETQKVAPKNTAVKEGVKTSAGKKGSASSSRAEIDKKTLPVKSQTASAATGVSKNLRKPTSKNALAPVDSTSDETVEQVIDYEDMKKPQQTPGSSSSVAVTNTAPSAKATPRDTKWASAPSYAKRQQEMEEYRRKLKEDPAFTPSVGKFWGHDDRFSGRGGSRGGFRGSRGRGWGYANRPVIAPPRDSQYHNQHQRQTQDNHFSQPAANGTSAGGRPDGSSLKNDGSSKHKTLFDHEKDSIDKAWVHDKFDEVANDTRPYGKSYTGNGPAKGQNRLSPSHRQSPQNRQSQNAPQSFQNTQKAVSSAKNPSVPHNAQKGATALQNDTARSNAQKVTAEPEVERVSFTIGEHAVTIVKQKSTPDLGVAAAAKSTAPTTAKDARPSVSNDRAVTKPPAPKRDLPQTTIVTAQPSSTAGPVRSTAQHSDKAISPSITNTTRVSPAPSNERNVAKVQGNEGAVREDLNSVTTSASPISVASAQPSSAAPPVHATAQQSKKAPSPIITSTTRVSHVESNERNVAKVEGNEQAVAEKGKSFTASASPVAVDSTESAPRASKRYLGATTGQQTSPTAVGKTAKSPPGSSKSPKAPSKSPTNIARSPTGGRIKSPTSGKKSPVGTYGQGGRHTINHQHYESTAHSGSGGPRELSTHQSSSSHHAAPVLGTDAPANPRSTKTSPRKRHNKSRLHGTSGPYGDLQQYDAVSTYPTYTSAAGYPVYTTAPAYPLFTSAAAASALPYVPTDELMSNGDEQMQVPQMQQPIMTHSGQFVYMTESGLVVPADNYSPTYGYPAPYPQYAAYAPDVTQQQSQMQPYAAGLDGNGYYPPQPVFYSAPPIFDPASGMLMASAPYYPPGMYHQPMATPAMYMQSPYQNGSGNSVVTARITELDAMNGADNGNGMGHRHHHYNHRATHHAQDGGNGVHKSNGNRYRSHGYSQKVHIRQPDSGAAVESAPPTDV